jgi:hypothetical protein
LNIFFLNATFIINCILETVLLFPFVLPSHIHTVEFSYKNVLNTGAHTPVLNQFPRYVEKFDPGKSIKIPLFKIKNKSQRQEQA